MSDLEKYEAVNKCETFEEFEKILLNFADEKTGKIQGRTREFDAKQMVHNAKIYYEDGDESLIPNVVTREFGLRQQLMYLKYYK